MRATQHTTRMPAPAPLPLRLSATMALALLLLLALSNPAHAQSIDTWTEPHIYTAGEIVGMVLGSIGIVLVVVAACFGCVWLNRRRHQRLARPRSSHYSTVSDLLRKGVAPDGTGTTVDGASAASVLSTSTSTLDDEKAELGYSPTGVTVMSPMARTGPQATRAAPAVPARTHGGYAARGGLWGDDSPPTAPNGQLVITPIPSFLLLMLTCSLAHAAATGRRVRVRHAPARTDPQRQRPPLQEYQLARCRCAAAADDTGAAAAWVWVL